MLFAFYAFVCAVRFASLMTLVRQQHYGIDNFHNLPHWKVCLILECLSYSILVTLQRCYKTWRLENMLFQRYFYYIFLDTWTIADVSINKICLEFSCVSGYIFLYWAAGVCICCMWLCNITTYNICYIVVGLHVLVASISAWYIDLYLPTECWLLYCITAIWVEFVLLNNTRMRSVVVFFSCRFSILPRNRS